MCEAKTCANTLSDSNISPIHPSIHTQRYIHTQNTHTHTRLYQHSHPLSQKLLPLYLTFTHTYTRSTKLTPILSSLLYLFSNSLTLSGKHTQAHIYQIMTMQKKKKRIEKTNNNEKQTEK